MPPTAAQSKASLESLTRHIGRQIFSAAQHNRPALASPAWWDEKMMAFSMRDERLKIQLFRFVDALPGLQSNPSINRHLREYLSDAGPSLPWPLRKALHYLPDNSGIGNLVARAARFNAQRLARRFIAGATLPETLATIEQMRKQRLAFTIDLLGEAVLSASEALAYQHQYLTFIEGLAKSSARWSTIPQIDHDHLGPIPKVNVSVKLSSLYSQFDPIDPAHTSQQVRARLRPILRLAKQHGVFVNIDMEQFAYKDTTLQILQDVLEEQEFRDWPDVGVAIQAYLKSCGDDLASLAHFAQRRGTPLWVRLVKGAYWDYETIIAEQNGWPTPVYTDKPATDANFERQTEFLIERCDLLRPAIASHNVRSIAKALALAEHHNVPKRMIEFQMLFGMAGELKDALVQRGERIRVYTPFGQLLPGMAYLVRRLLENTSNQSFLRAGFLEGVPIDQLLADPATQNGSPTMSTQQRVVADPPQPAQLTFDNEPLADFSQAPARDAMAAALDEVKSQLGRDHPAIINHKPIPAQSWLESLNPSHSRQVVGRFPRTTKQDADAAIRAAHAAFPAWRDTSPEDRAALLRRAAQLMRERRYDLAAWAIVETGKPWRESDADVAEAIDFCEFYAAEMLRLSTPRIRNVAGEENAHWYEPRGACVIIAPWNFPLAILTGMTAAALVTGNTAVMKPAEQSSIIAAHLMNIWIEAGFPPGIVNYLPGIGEEIGPTLVGHPLTTLIAFTGSRQVGLAIHRQASEWVPGQEHIKKVIAELGGKNAVIIDEDADLDEAVHGVAASAFSYAGQKCSAASRVIILEPLYESFLNRLTEVTRSLRLGPAEDPGVFISPVIDAEARDRIVKMIDQGKREAHLLASIDLGPLADEGFYVAPHLFSDVKPDSSLAQQEIFGPVLAAIKARDLDHALQIANATPYALTGGLYSRSPSHIEKVRRQFKVGNLYINRKITGALVDRQPFGGFKLSGVGSKAGGPDYLQQFMLPRVITENTLRHGFAPPAAESSTPGE